MSGNVSLYNETNGEAIPPTPGHRRRRPGAGHRAHGDASRSKREGDLLVVDRPRGRATSASRSISRSSTGKLEGAPPPVDLADEIKAGNLVRVADPRRQGRAVHDVSDGGLLVAVAEMALAGGIGVQLFPYEGKLPAHAAWFGEDQGRYVLEAAPALAEEIIERARLLALPARVVGRVGGDALALKGEAALPLADLRGRTRGLAAGVHGPRLDVECRYTFVLRNRVLHLHQSTRC